ncbi:aldose 1-epimerase family protein [Schlesneria sp. DSM 10557]|uniref:aldose 1-epimerase family protein n=1 Tax=Schlesneria sp. DSM 10557 TaxID=3044399 RepID=UPI00359F296A
MTIQTLVLTDADAGVHLDHGELRPNNTMDLRGSPHWSIRWRTLRGGVSDGVDVVELDNGHLSLCILPTRGMGIWKGRFNDLPLEWKSPVERPVHPKFVNQLDRGGIGWLHGFNELLCRCGLAFLGPPGDDRGEKLTLHGRIANLPAHRVEVRVDTTGPGSLELRGVVDESSMFGARWRLTTTYRLEAGSNYCSITDDITNLGGQPAELSLLYHINIGRPFLEPYASYAVPSIEVAPRDARAAQGIDNYQIYGAPVAGFQEQVYFHTPIGGGDGWTTALLANASGHAGFAVHFQTRQLPTFSVWKNTVAEADGYVTGLEPGIVFPNFRGFERERGRLPIVQPGHTYRSELALEVADTLDSVRKITDRIHLLQGKTATTVHRQPIERLSAVPK